MLIFGRIVGRFVLHGGEKSLIKAIDSRARVKNIASPYPKNIYN